ncbi:MAG: alpha/beta fold hydrolase, partial [Phenylobacterium sp.]
GKEKIALLSWSFGSISGLKMIKARPDLFSVYAGTGQEIDQPAEPRRYYDQALRWAREAGDKATMAGLRALGPPPYDAAQEEALWALDAVVRPSEGRTAADERNLALTMPGWSLAELLAAQTAGQATRRHFTEVSKEHGRFEAASLGLDYQVPIILIHGEWDDPGLSAGWLGQVRAPHKAAVVLSRAGHSALIVEPEAFGAALRREVLPLARAGDMQKPPPGGATASR